MDRKSPGKVLEIGYLKFARTLSYRFENEQAKWKKIHYVKADARVLDHAKTVVNHAKTVATEFFVSCLTQ